MKCALFWLAAVLFFCSLNSCAKSPTDIQKNGILGAHIRSKKVQGILTAVEQPTIFTGTVTGTLTSRGLTVNGEVTGTATATANSGSVTLIGSVTCQGSGSINCKVGADGASLTGTLAGTRSDPNYIFVTGTLNCTGSGNGPLTCSKPAGPFNSFITFSGTLTSTTVGTDNKDGVGASGSGTVSTNNDPAELPTTTTTTTTEPKETTPTTTESKEATTTTTESREATTTTTESKETTPTATESKETTPTATESTKTTPTTTESKKTTPTTTESKEATTTTTESTEITTTSTASPGEAPQKATEKPKTPTEGKTDSSNSHLASHVALFIGTIALFAFV